MNTKKVTSSIVAVLFGLMTAGVALASEIGPESITFKGGKKGQVTLSHKKHQEGIQCGECHHGMADGKQVAYKEGQKIEKCATCHNKDLANEKLQKPKNAFHKNCKGCHKAQKKGPTKCKECHKKK